jgi:LysM repeat protein
MLQCPIDLSAGIRITSIVLYGPFNRYNCRVGRSISIRWCLLSLLLIGFLGTPVLAGAAQPLTKSPSSAGVTAYDLIVAMNTLRVSYGNPALTEDPIINAVAQSTAETMAANQMSWHIGNVSGRLASAGYGGGATVWATENFAVGNLSIDEIMVIWSDASHMIPAVNPAYCNIGAGVAKAANGRYYYVLQAAYTSAEACGEYISPVGTSSSSGVSQWIVPVKIATPDENGEIYHVVETGQSFWSIAVAYSITIHDLETWNNLSREIDLQIGQRLFIPGPNTEGYSTPTPVGMIHISTPDPDGKIVHTVEAYQTLTTIAQAYETSIQTILSLNGIESDWPLQIGQKLVIDPGRITPSPTPRPLTPIEKLTPASDGRYYHIVQPDENLSWIAKLYNVSVSDLMAWNGLNEASVIQPDQKLLLHVTPPATATLTPMPATATVTTPTAIPSRLPTETATIQAEIEGTPVPEGRTAEIWFLSLGVVIVGGVALAVFLSRRKQE